MYDKILDILYDGVYFVDKDRRITFWNKSAEEITGYKKDEVVGKFCYSNILSHIDQEGNKLCFNNMCPLNQTLQDGKKREALVFLHNKKGYRIPVKIKVTPLIDNGKIIGAAEIFFDNTENIINEEILNRYKKKAFLDELTSIFNRRFLKNKIDADLNSLRRYNLPFGIIFLDIDNFKLINDTYGHVAGDKILINVANTISKNVRSFDTAGRWGGEEFVCIIENVTPKSLFSVAEKLRFLIENSDVYLEDVKTYIKVTVSIGATVAKTDDNINTLIKRADDLMYKSKIRGKNLVTVA